VGFISITEGSVSAIFMNGEGNGRRKIITHRKKRIMKIRIKQKNMRVKD
jgi:hypothetical protein